jgi:hypothetical protein
MEMRGEMEVGVGVGVEAEETRQTVIAILVFLVISHTIFGLAGIVSMVSFFVGGDFPVADYLSFLSVFSYLICQRCVAIDAYDYVKADTENLPDYAKDNYFRKKIHNFKGTQSVDYTHLRLDILSNLEPLKVCLNPDEFSLFFNRKVQYIVFNTILLLALAVKYDKKQYLILYMLWVFWTFPA